MIEKNEVPELQPSSLAGGKHGFDKWVIDSIDMLEKTAMLG